ncbi:hypothetical protein J7K60_06010 [Candidatus Bipolaricaulota bacterium]|nr:hypothetical protein [Candidatus Bipolaricaulota bacterium]HHR84800.1 hypothetical protein [Candidatus Acetothermia bacterium]
MNDLLTLIGSSIENLRQCIDLFDNAQPDGGAERISSVLAEIDGYLKEIDTDPLLELASIDRGQIADRLQSIEVDLASILSELADQEHEYSATD